MKSRLEQQPQARPAPNTRDRQRPADGDPPTRKPTADTDGGSGLGALVIRRAMAGDAEAIGRLYALEARLQEDLGGYCLNEAFDWAQWASTRLGDPGYRIFVAERGTLIVGSVHARLRFSPGGPQSPPRGGWLRRAVRAIRALGGRGKGSMASPGPAAPASFEGWAIIESLYVVESERRRGLARRLVAAATDDLASAGATRIEISVMAANAPAMAFWSHLGFRAFRAHLVTTIDRGRD